MLLHLARDRIQITRTRMWRQSLPLFECSSCGCYCGMHILRCSLGYSSEDLSRRGIGSLEVFARRSLLPCAVDEVIEAALMLIQPSQCLTRIFERRPILHRQKFLCNAHSSVIANCVLKSLRNRMAVICRVTASCVVLKLAFDIGQHATRAEAEELCFQP